MAEDGALRRARQFAQRGLKYKQAVLIDELGNPARAPESSPEPYIMVKPTDEIPAGKTTGCPCCLAPLRQMKETLVLGSVTRPAHFRSKEGIQSHLDRDCPIDHSSEDVEGHVKSMLKFVTAPVGENQRKILYLNMPGTRENPIVLDVRSTDPADFHHAIREGLRTKFLTAAKPQDVATLSVKNGAEIVGLLKHPLAPTDFADQIDVINHGRRFPLNELLAGYDWQGVYEEALSDEDFGFAYPSLVEMNISGHQGGAPDLVVSEGSGIGKELYQIVLRAHAQGEDQRKIEELFEKGGHVLVFGTARALEGKARAKFLQEIKGNSAFLDIGEELKLIEYTIERFGDIKPLKGSQRLFSFEHTLAARESHMADEYHHAYTR